MYFFFLLLLLLLWLYFFFSYLRKLIDITPNPIYSCCYPSVSLPWNFSFETGFIHSECPSPVFNTFLLSHVFRHLRWIFIQDVQLNENASMRESILYYFVILYTSIPFVYITLLLFLMSYDVLFLRNFSISCVRRNLPDIEEHFPPWPSNSPCALFDTFHQTVIILRHGRRFCKKRRWWPLQNQNEQGTSQKNKNKKKTHLHLHLA